MAPRYPAAAAAELVAGGGAAELVAGGGAALEEAGGGAALEEAGGGAALEEAGGGAALEAGGGFGPPPPWLCAGFVVVVRVEVSPSGFRVSITVWPVLFRDVTTVTRSPAASVLVDVLGAESCGRMPSVGCTAAALVGAVVFAPALGLAPVSPCGGPEIARAGAPTSSAAATPPITGRRR